MRLSDKEVFFKNLEAGFEIMAGKKIEPDQIKIWWDIFKDCQLNNFLAALKRTIEREQGRLTPAKVKKYLRSKSNRPGAEEAFSHLLTVIDDCGYLSDTMRASWRACSSHLDTNDRVAARMAFREKYDALTAVSDFEENWTWYQNQHIEYDECLKIKQEKIVDLGQAGLICSQYAQNQIKNLTQDSKIMIEYDSKKQPLKHDENAEKVGREALKNLKNLFKKR